MVLKDTYLAYVHPKKGTVSDILLMDRDFDISSGILRTGYKDGIIMSNLSRSVNFPRKEKGSEEKGGRDRKIYIGKDGIRERRVASYKRQ